MKPHLIEISRYPITLGQLLKHADVCADGVEAKRVIGAGRATVNGTVETRRGRKLFRGDTVLVNDHLLQCG